MSPTRIQFAKRDIVAAFDALGPNVYNHKTLATILATHRDSWRLAGRTRANEFIDYLVSNSDLKRARFTSKTYKPIERFIWKDATPFQLGLSLKADSYLSHTSAVFLHGLSDQIPNTIYVNREQGLKPSGTPSLTQDGINRAFAREQRLSNYIYELAGHRYVLLSGKNTNQLGVVRMRGPAGEELRVTDLERTLIDIVVRPAYSGGIYEILEAYKAAIEHVSVGKLIVTMRKLNHAYPFHQAIGFLMERASYAPDQVERIHRLGTSYDFFLTHGMDSPEFSEKWRLFYPRGF